MHIALVILETLISLICIGFINAVCYTSQLKYVFRMEENVSRAMGQNSLTP